MSVPANLLDQDPEYRAADVDLLGVLAYGELSAFDLYRVRQIQLEAQRMQASAAVSVGAAVSRVNQAQGYAP